MVLFEVLGLEAITRGGTPARIDWFVLLNEAIDCLLLRLLPWVEMCELSIFFLRGVVYWVDIFMD